MNTCKGTVLVRLCTWQCRLSLQQRRERHTRPDQNSAPSGRGVSWSTQPPLLGGVAPGVEVAYRESWHENRVAIGPDQGEY